MDHCVQILSLLLDWSRGPNMPYAMSGNIQAVTIDQTVYVGGGDTGRAGGNPIVMVFNTQSSKWHTLPRYNCTHFSMAVVRNQLVLVGGYHSTGLYSREIGVWQKKWWQPYSPMATGRSKPSSTCYKQWLVVAGGSTAVNGEDHTMEILNVDTNQWSVGPSIPTLLVMRKSTAIQNMWYFVGGGALNVAYGVSLDAIVTQQSSMSSNTWQKLVPLKSNYSCLLNCEDALLAVGGIKMDQKQTSAIMSYEPQSRTWVLVGDLPQSLYCGACIAVAAKMYVFGGFNGPNQLIAMHYSYL